MRNNLDMELLELGVIDRARSPQHQVLVALGLRKRNDITDVFRAGEHHHDAVDSGCDASVRRDAVLERIEQVTKPLADRLARMAQDLEDPFLQRAVVNADASTAKLIAVAHDV